jgi:hypothetical protein
MLAEIGYAQVQNRPINNGPSGKREASFRLIVSGNIGVKEIERLIKTLEPDDVFE